MIVHVSGIWWGHDPIALCPHEALPFSWACVISGPFLHPPAPPAEDLAPHMAPVFVWMCSSLQKAALSLDSLQLHECFLWLLSRVATTPIASILQCLCHGLARCSRVLDPRLVNRILSHATLSHHTERQILPRFPTPHTPPPLITAPVCTDWTAASLGRAVQLLGPFLPALFYIEIP